MRLIPYLAAALLVTSTALHAQAPSSGGAKGRRFDCSQAKDPKACEERVAKLRAARDKARKACEGKSGEEHNACMRQQLCAGAKDPKACEERAARAKPMIEKARQACAGKTGSEHRDCMVHETCAQAKDPAACEARAKQRLEKRQQRRSTQPPAK